MTKAEKNSLTQGTVQRGGVVETDSKQSSLRDALLSSQTRLRIAELASRRPRTLRELARLTGLSIPGVLRHIEALSKVGLISEEAVATKTIPARKMYSLKGVRVMDFSVDDLTVFKVSTNHVKKEKVPRDLERQAVDIFVSRRRIRGKARRLAREIDDLEEQEAMLAKGINNLMLTDEERLVLFTVYTEDTTEDAERVLTRIQGMKDARRSIDEALARAK